MGLIYSISIMCFYYRLNGVDYTSKLIKETFQKIYIYIKKKKKKQTNKQKDLEWAQNSYEMTHLPSNPHLLYCPFCWVLLSHVDLVHVADRNIKK